MSKRKKGIDCIPEGYYCYIGDYICPYWSIKPDLPEQANGYCAYLGKSDVDLHNDRKHDVTDTKTGEKVDPAEMPFCLGLLWDQCKECGIKEGDE